MSIPFILAILFLTTSGYEIVFEHELPDLSLPFLLPNNVSTECHEKLLHMLNQFLHDDADTAALLYSGKGLNQLGNYQDCINTNHSQYILMNIEGVPLVFNLGFCAPIECGIEEYELVKPHLAAILNNLVQAVKPKESEVNINITEEDIQFIESAKVNAEGTAVSLGTILTVSIIGTLIFLSILASVIRAYNPSISKSGNVIAKIMYSFDLGRNLDSLMKVDDRHDSNLKVFNGIRVLSMLWVVFGHSFMIGRIAPADNPGVVANYLNEFSKAHIYNAGLSVDVFFFFSGFLLCYVLMSSRNTKVDWKLYLHRLIRLYPSLIFSYVLCCYILPVLGDGPTFYKYLDSVKGDCTRIVYHVMFFAYNFRPHELRCMGWIWYIANDMQFFIISPPIIYVLLKFPKVAVSIILFLILGSYAVTIWVASTHEIYASLSRYHEDYAKYYYDMPYARIAPYLIGILFAYFYVCSKRNGSSAQKIIKAFSKSLSLRLVCYIVGLLGCFFTLHGLYWLNKYPNDYARWVDMVYLVFSRSVFIVFLFILCIPPLAGKGRLMNLLLSNKLMSVLAKLTYGVYMTHEGIMEYYVYSMHTSVFVAYDQFVFWFCSNAVFGHLAATFLFLFIESPIFNMEDAFLRRRANKGSGGRIAIDNVLKNSMTMLTEDKLKERGLSVASRGDLESVESLVINKE